MLYPKIPGFAECWADTIISCPFCDGYENRDHIVANSKMLLDLLPKMVQNWISKINQIYPDINLDFKFTAEQYLKTYVR